jgi:hypothetical protein
VVGGSNPPTPTLSLKKTGIWRVLSAKFLFFYAHPYPLRASYATIKKKGYLMAQRKNDGVIEAVRYTPGGDISVVRAYQRRGVVWSDQVLLPRAELVEQLSRGKRFVTGVRKAALGSVFETRSEVRFVDKHIVNGGQPALRDLLAGVPVF